jgi:hypothetical protein
VSTGLFCSECGLPIFIWLWLRKSHADELWHEQCREGGWHLAFRASRERPQMETKRVPETSSGTTPK